MCPQGLVKENTSTGAEETGCLMLFNAISEDAIGMVQHSKYYIVMFWKYTFIQLNCWFRVWINSKGAIGTSCDKYVSHL